jgi:dTDP-glucose 4,6-dehydratase
LEEFKRLNAFIKDRPGHDRIYALNIYKIKRELRQAPSTDFMNGMDETVKYFIDKFGVGG